MKKLLLLCTLLLACAGGAARAMGQADIVQHASCQHCGMNCQEFAHSRMLIKYADSSSAELCSLHCAVLDLANKLGKTPVAIKVGDYNSKELIDAKAAAWVLGGKIKGGMAGRATWAFATKDDAMKFAAENGGEVVDLIT